MAAVDGQEFQELVAGGTHDGGSVTSKGRDTLGTPPRRHNRVTTTAGIALLALGLILLVGVGLYQAYKIQARSQLDELAFTVEDPLPSRPDGGPAEVIVAGLGIPSISSPSSPSSLSSPSAPERTEAAPAPLALLGYASVYPGVQMHPKYWNEPLWAGTDQVQDARLPDGFRLVSSSTGGVDPGVATNARRIHIPAIGVDASVKELEILDLGDSRAYETPDNVVGHIPGTANAGEVGNGWFFGHLESPFKGEGSVFRNLPKIGDYVKNGDTVYVRIETSEGEYLYQVSVGTVVYKDDLRLYDSEDATITLVVCVPRLDYSHRFLVTAKLVGIKN